MNPTISELMHRDVVTIDMDDRVDAVQRLFAQRHLSWAPVRDADGAVVGVLSLSDLDRLHAEGRDAHAVPAWQACSYKALAAAPGERAADVARRMVDRHLHHVVVMDG